MDVVQGYLLVTFNIFQTFFSVSLVDFDKVIVR